MDKPYDERAACPPTLSLCSARLDNSLPQFLQGVSSWFAGSASIFHQLHPQIKGYSTVRNGWGGTGPLDIRHGGDQITGFPMEERASRISRHDYYSPKSLFVQVKGRRLDPGSGLSADWLIGTVIDRLYLQRADFWSTMP